MPTMTLAQVECLRAARHAVHVYPRKKLVVVDGYKRFRLVTTTQQEQRP